MKFSELGLCPELLAGIETLGFESPTPVQSKVIPFLLENDTDLIALAQTGTGKTGAFGLPILEQIDQTSRKTQALILCPTRELCVQITRDLHRFSKKMPAISTLALYGGADIRPQLDGLDRGAHIIVATPGRMLDLLGTKKADLSALRRVVLDEADEMLNMGFEEDLNAIFSDVPDAAQILLFSATMPRQVGRMARNNMNDPHEITIGSRSAVAETVQHEFVMAHAKDRYAALRRVADGCPGIFGIIFCRTKMETQMVSDRLNADGYNSAALHGDLTQEERDLVMRKFRKHQTQLLVATDIAARGLDVNDLSHVIHYVIPDDFNTYTHRSGRTGRAGKTGVSIAIIHLREHFKLERIQKVLGKEIAQRAIPTGQEIGRIQLLNLAERLRDYPADPELLADNLEEMCAVLKDVSKEELIQRIALMEQRPRLEYYRDTPDLSTEPEKVRPKQKPENSISGREAREAHVPRQMTPGMIELVANIGKRNKVTAALLKELIDTAGVGAPVQIGRLNIVDMQTYFEVPYALSTDLINYFTKNETLFDGRRFKVALAGNAKPAESPKRKPRHKGGYKGRPSSRKK
ncbi:DEAD/DEAH box helicase [Verrucomicrobiota bacterium]